VGFRQSFGLAEDTVKRYQLLLLFLIIISSVSFLPVTGYTETSSPQHESIQPAEPPPASDASEADDMEDVKNEEKEETPSEVPARQEEGSVKKEEQDKEEEESTTEDEEDEEYLEEEEMETIADPLKPFNQLMFNFNDKLYFYLLKPVAQVYEAVLPEPVRVSVRNFISNITTPVRLLNCILQGKVEKAGIEYARFMVNTIAGGLGFFDVAKKYHNLEKHDEDFGQTLGFYGMKEGFYIVWPFFGPSNVRDTLGSVGNFFSDPFVYVNPTTDIGITKINSNINSGINATYRVNETSLTLGTYEEFKESSIDPYVSMRSAYFEMRRKKIKE
jgi:phospholipid-binding lipoprotein MlaA